MQQQPATYQPSSSATDMDSAQYAEVARRAQELRDKAQQLANTEQLIMNQAVDLNLLAKQLAEATIRPRPMQSMPPLPISFLLPGSITNTSLHKMQLVRPQGFASSSLQYCSTAAAAAAADNYPTGDQGTALATLAAETACVSDVAAGAAAAEQQQATADAQQQPNYQQPRQHLAHVAQDAAAAVQQQHRSASISASDEQESHEKVQGEAVDMDAD